MHDIISNTTVVDDESNGRSTGLIVALIAGTILLITLIGILATIVIPAHSGYGGKAHVAQAYPQAMAATLHYDIQTGQLIVEFSPGHGTLAVSSPQLHTDAIG